MLQIQSGGTNPALPLPASVLTVAVASTTLRIAQHANEIYLLRKEVRRLGGILPGIPEVCLCRPLQALGQTGLDEAAT